MLENIMTNDELADAFRDLFDQLHAKIEDLPEGAVKNKAKRLGKIAHGAMNALKELAVDQDVIQPFSGGDDDKPD